MGKPKKSIGGFVMMVAMMFFCPVVGAALGYGSDGTTWGIFIGLMCGSFACVGFFALKHSLEKNKNL